MLRLLNDHELSLYLSLEAILVGRQTPGTRSPALSRRDPCIAGEVGEILVSELQDTHVTIYVNKIESLPHLGGYPFLKIPERIETNEIEPKVHHPGGDGWLCNVDDAEKLRMPMDGWAMSQPPALHV